MTNNILLLALGLKAAESNASDKNVLIGGMWINVGKLFFVGKNRHYNEF